MVEGIHSAHSGFRSAAQTKRLRMKHPSREEMMSYLYDELELQPRAALERHLEACAACRASLAAWRSTAHQLDTYATTPVCAARPTPRSWARPALVAAAAALVLFAGFALGHSGGVSRAELEAVRLEAAAQAQAAAGAETQRQLQQFAADLGKRLDALQAQHITDYATLRKELETVAVLTEAGFRQAENRFVALADTTSTSSTPAH